MPLINSLKACCPACGLPLSGENLIAELCTDRKVRRRCRACTRRRKADEMRAARARKREAAQAEVRQAG